MPAAAVIPAPIAYIKVVAVKKLVVEFRIRAVGLPSGMYCRPGLHLSGIWSAFNRVGQRSETITLKKLECSKQAYA